MILNVHTQHVTPVNPKSKFKYFCHGESIMEGRGLILSLVCDSNKNIHLIRFN